MKSGRIATAHNSQAGFYPYDIEYSVKSSAVDGSRYYSLRSAGFTPTDNKKSVLSLWCKRAELPAADYNIFWSWYSQAGYYGYIGFDNAHKLRMVHRQASVVTWDAVTTSIHRDTSQHMHVYFKIDSTVPEMSIVVNGIPVTDWTTYSPPSLNYVNCSMGGFANWYTAAHYLPIGDFYLWDGYISDFHLFDGVTPPYTEFGEFKNNTWVPKEFTDTTTYPYGNAGIRMDYSNSENVMEDTSGNGVEWTAGGSPSSQSLDTPTNNFPILDATHPSPLYVRGAGLEIVNVATAWDTTPITVPFPSTGKWIVEAYAVSLTAANYGFVGIMDETMTYIGSYPGAASNGIGYITNGTIYTNGTSVAGYAALTSSEICTVVYDADIKEVTFYVDGVLQETTDLSSLLTGDVFFVLASYAAGNIMRLVSGAEGLSYPVEGTKTLCTDNWPNSETSIINSEDGFWIKDWTGDGSGDRDITGSPFNLSNNSLVWQKIKTQAYNHRLLDTERGPNKVLGSNLTTAEASDSVHGVLDAFLSNGFSTIAGTTGNDNWNMNTEDYIAWVFNMLPKYGMDIVTYTGDGLAGNTIEHNLGIAPELMLVKDLDGTTVWVVGCQYQASSTPWSYYLILNQTDAIAGPNTAAWNSTPPTSSVFTLGAGGANYADTRYVAYLFRSVPGFLKVGYYIGNGSADGPRIYTGFRVRYLLTKDCTAASGWRIFDSARNTYNYIGEILLANLTNAGASAELVDFLANGFKLRTTAADSNASGHRYIYLAIGDAYPYVNAF